MQNLISNIKICRTTHTPPTGPGNTFHAISSPSEKKNEHENLVLLYQSGRRQACLPRNPKGWGEAFIHLREGCIYSSLSSL